MSVVRPTDGLLPASSTVALIELLAARPEGASVERIIRDLAASIPISWSRARNTIAKLIAYNVICHTDKMAVAIGCEAPDDWYEWVAHCVARDFTSQLTQTGAWSCLKFEPDAGAIIIDAMTVPAMPDGLGMWVTDFRVANRDAIQARYWTVTQVYSAMFLERAREANAQQAPRAKTAERLAIELARQAEQGEAAELWVVEFERQRLRDHPLRDQIRRVATDDVSAGYDILSFASLASLQHDLFIEVKSYGTTKLFHWSRNEIATAREFGEAYALYLVERARCTETGYIPHIITGPSPEMFALPDSGWRVEPTSFEHLAVRA